jgi:hypothetical protein
MDKQYYIIIDPFTFKPIEFSEFVKDDVIVATSTTINDKRVFERKTALCIPVDTVDASLLGKIYDPSTGAFN